MPTILQLSDFHLLGQREGRLNGIPTAESFRLVVEQARRQCESPDCVVLSGDLSHDHSVEGYEILRDLLGDWVDRSQLIPGNHDDRRAMRRVFQQIPDHASDQEVADRRDEVWFQQFVGDWQLIGLDSQVPDETHGELSEAMLRRLSVWLQESAGRPALIFVHHQPASVKSRSFDEVGLRNAAQLERVLAENRNARGLFCGHIHHEFQGEVAGIPFFSAPSTAFQFAPASDATRFDLLPPGFRVIELDRYEFQTHTIRLDEMPFQPVEEA